MNFKLINFFFPIVKLNFPTPGTREDFIYNGSFHEAVGLILASAQLFGIMPVSGIRAKTPRSLKFKKFSFRFLFSVAVIFGMLWVLVMEVIWIYRSKLEFGKLINFVFDSSNFVSIICFMELATKWPQLMKKWDEVEKFLPQLKYQMDKQKLAYEIKIVTMAIFSMSLGKISCVAGTSVNYVI